MHQFMVSRKKHATVEVVCGGCGNRTPLHGAKRIKVPKDKIVFWVDGRRKTPTGGRFGESGSAQKRVCFPKMETAWGCPSCQMLYKVVVERI